MGAKKWATILKEDYLRTGRVFNDLTLEQEIKMYTYANFRNPTELIIWSDARHYTLKYFCRLYFNYYLNVSNLACLVEEMFTTRLVTKELYNLLSDDVISSLSDKFEANVELLEKIITTIESKHEIRKDTFTNMLWLHSTIKSLKENNFNREAIRDLVCLIARDSRFIIVNQRASLKLISNLNKVKSEERSIS
jgi:hypothetical protein